jgi:hypothetical protein
VNKFGIPDRTLGRISVNMATVVLSPMEEGEQTIARATADYVWLTGKYPRRPSFFHQIHQDKKTVMNAEN